MPNLPPIVSVRKSGVEHLHFDGKASTEQLLGFWQWSSSELLGNTLRGVFAEYLVGTDLDCVSELRQEWDAYDLITKDGIKVEVKSSAYLQSWDQDRLSPIKFGCAQSYGWDARTNSVSDVLCRPSDVYVFCVITHQDKTTVDPLNLSQWTFYIVATKTLDKLLGEQASLSLSKLLKLNPIVRSYGDIASGIREALE